MNNSNRPADVDHPPEHDPLLCGIAPYAADLCPGCCFEACGSADPAVYREWRKKQIRAGSRGWLDHLAEHERLRSKVETVGDVEHVVNETVGRDLDRVIEEIVILKRSMEAA